MRFLRVMLSSIWRILTHNLTSKAFSEISCGVATQAESIESRICLSAMKYRFTIVIFQFGSVVYGPIRENARLAKKVWALVMRTNTFIARPRPREYLLITWYANCCVKFSLPYMEIETSWHKTWFAFILHVNVVIILA